MRARRGAGLLALGAALATAGLAPAVASSASPTTTVTLRNISFIRSTVHIRKGGSVKWVWKDPTVPHNVTFAHQHSTTKQSGKYRLTFHHAGTYRYHCTIHPGMVGKVVVS
jgi:plastocyanin